MEDESDEKDDTKRKARNLSEKKRRDQFNLLINELSTMVSATSGRKMDKSTVLKSTISFFKTHNELTVHSTVDDIKDDWKPEFLTNEEFTHLILEALNGFIIIFATNGRIFYASESITSLLGYLPSDLMDMTIYDITYEDDHTELYNALINPAVIIDPVKNDLNDENLVSFTCHLRRGELDYNEQITYELVEFTGYFRKDTDNQSVMYSNPPQMGCIDDINSRILFIGISRIQTQQIIREMSIISTTKSEFTSRHNLEWKYLFLDHRAPPIIGYMPFELLGTSGYDYYHFDDLEKVVATHEALKEKGEETSCFYRFLTKGQQWIWLQTKYSIHYYSWNSKPEFVVCNHRVISQSDVMRTIRSQANDIHCQDFDSKSDVDKMIKPPTPILSSDCSGKSAKTKIDARTSKRRHRHHTYHGSGSDITSVSGDSPFSKYSCPTPNVRRGTNESVSKLSSSSHHGSPTLTTSIVDTSQFTTQYHNQSSSSQIPNSSFIETNKYNVNVSTITVQQPAPTITTSLMPPSNYNMPMMISQQRPIISTTTPESTIQNELERKQEELQQIINHQQDELRRVSEQLMTARYTLANPVAIPLISSSINASANIVQTINSPISQDLSSEHIQQQKQHEEQKQHHEHTHHHLSHSHHQQQLQYSQTSQMDHNPHQLSTIVSNYNPMISLDHQTNEEYSSYMQLTSESHVQMQQNSHLMENQQLSQQYQHQQPHPQQQQQQQLQQHSQQR